MKGKVAICETCPWLRKNQGKKHAGGWYSMANLRRLWAGLRSGAAPGMICHSSDPNSREYGGSGKGTPGKEAECGGAVMLLCLNMEAFQENRPQPIRPPMTRAAMGSFAWRLLMRGGTIEVTGRTSDIGVPWQK